MSEYSRLVADEDRSQGVVGRRLIFCHALQTYFSTDQLITYCNKCHRFFAKCCKHRDVVCHHYRIAFTDGACLNNGQVGAVAGIGIVLGLEGFGEDQWAIPVDDSVDPGAKRSSQRAELLAAIVGLRRLREPYINEHPDDNHPSRLEPKAWVIASDSEYVVKGVTEWLPVWKSHGWRTSQGVRPSNLDLFLLLDEALNELEGAPVGQRVRVGFWHISRRYNGLADSLAKLAARSAA